MIPLPSPYGEPPNPATYMEHQYFIRDGIVDYIRVYNFDLAPNYYMPAFLQSYGRPTEILVRTYREYEMGLHPFLIDLFYEDKGILVEYSAENPTTEGNKLKNCLKELKSPFIYLWSPNEQKLSFQDAYEKFLDTRSLPEPIPLLLATGVDVNTFYKTYKDPEADFCIKTDKSLWP